MILTKQKSSKQSILAMEIANDFEIINPIESKALFGGCDYCTGYDPNFSHYGGTYGPGIVIVIGGGNSGGSGGTGYGGHIPGNFYPGGGGNDNGGGGSGGYSNPYWSDTNGNGINDADETSTWVDANGDGIDDSLIDPACQIANLPQNVAQQIGNMCTMESFSFVSALLGSSATLNSISTILATHPQIGPMAIIDGLTAVQLTIAINTLFISTVASSIGQIQLALCNSQPTLTTINGGTHQVTIVGYNQANSTFTVADSQWASNNGYHDVPVSSIDLSNSYIISGVRP